MTGAEWRALGRLLRSPDQRRHAWSWFRSRRPDYLLDVGSPWLTFGAIDFLRRVLPRGLRAFEYGSGGSTLFWLRFAPALVVSIEHDTAWYRAVRARLPPNANVDHRLVPPDPRAEGGAPPDVADPDAYASADATWAKHDFRRYATQIDDFPPGNFDLVLVDGRARPACLRHAAPRVRVGGWLVLDNSDRRYYLERMAPDLANFAPAVFRGAVPNSPDWSETTIFTRRA